MMKNLALLLFAIVTATSSIFGQNKEMMNKELLLQDLAFLGKKLADVHPNIYTNVEENKFKRHITDIKNELQEDKTIEDFYLLIAPLVASIEDGHTNTLPIASKNRMDYLNNGGLTIPLK